MAISDLSKAVEAKIPWRTCATCYALSVLPEDEAAALRGLLANPTVRYRELAAAIASDPDVTVKIPWEALSRHARGDCDAEEKLR